jgi:hypothetical protein
MRLKFNLYDLRKEFKHPYGSACYLTTEELNSVSIFSLCATFFSRIPRYKTHMTPYGLNHERDHWPSGSNSVSMQFCELGQPSVTGLATC